MAERWCPRCRGEFRAGITMCADCGVALVDTLDESEVPVRVHTRAVDQFGPDERVVELTRLPAMEADMVAAQLRDLGIRTVVLGVGATARLAAIQYAEGSRVMVSDVDLERAAAYLDAADAGAVGMVSDEELAAQAEAAAGFSDPSTGAVV
jgi:hypothetical protein